MSKANEKKLSNLHGAVAEVLTAQLTQTEAETTFDEEGNCVETGEQVYSAPPATIAVAVKFLKDNQITCDIETDENMNGLREALSKKQRHSRLQDANVVALKAQGE